MATTVSKILQSERRQVRVLGVPMTGTPPASVPQHGICAYAPDQHSAAETGHAPTEKGTSDPARAVNASSPRSCDLVARDAFPLAPCQGNGFSRVVGTQRIIEAVTR